GSGASEPRATVCSDTVVSAPANAPTEIQPAILSLWLMSKESSPLECLKIYTCKSHMTHTLRPGSGGRDANCVKVPRFTGTLRPTWHCGNPPCLRKGPSAHLKPCPG